MGRQCFADPEKEKQHVPGVLSSGYLGESKRGGRVHEPRAKKTPGQVRGSYRQVGFPITTTTAPTTTPLDHTQGIRWAHAYEVK